MKILQTPRLVLREFAPQDADALALVLSDPETMRYYPAPYDPAGVEQWIERNRQRYQQEAETYRNDVLPRARGAAAKEVLDAEAYRLQVLALAQGETARFDQVLTQYEHAPAVTRERMYLEAMENVYKNSRKVIVDTKNGNSMMYLPLDKLISPGLQSITMPNDTMTVPPARIPEIQVAPPEDPARARGVR